MSCSPLQYIHIYEANTDAFGPRPDTLLRLRSEELPDEFAPDFGLNVRRVSIPMDIAASFRCGVPTLSTSLAIMANDSFVATDALIERLPDGVTIMSLAQAMRQGLYTPSTPEPDALTDINDLLIQDGVYIRIAARTHLSRPLQVVNLLSAPFDLMAVRRIVVEMERDTEARLLICNHTQDPERQYLASEVIHLSLAENARLELVGIDESSEKTATFLSLRANLASGASLRSTTSALGHGTLRGDYRVHLDGNESEAYVNGMIIAPGQSQVSCHTALYHHGQHTHSNQLFKYVADDQSSCQFCGRIIVDEAARFTEAYQSNRNILGSTQARMHTEPTLEIYCDEVKCSHGAATGQLDPTALFYMRSRGIPEPEARRMLMEAFMADVIDEIHIDGLPDRMRHLVERRFSGADPQTCSSCHV